jgi:hypothetical protein
VHVRTARLVAVTVARRAGLSEDVVESVRQGVGEACALVVRGATGADRLEIMLDDAPGDLVVRVHPAPVGFEGDDQLARAVLTGLTDDLTVISTPRGDELRLHWGR